jgi:hypothetical protein
MDRGRVVENLVGIACQIEREEMGNVEISGVSGNICGGRGLDGWGRYSAMGNIGRGWKGIWGGY